MGRGRATGRPGAGNAATLRTDFFCPRLESRGAELGVRRLIKAMVIQRRQSVRAANPESPLVLAYGTHPGMASGIFNVI